MGFEKQLIVAAAVFALVSQGEAIMGGRVAASHSRPYMASIQAVLANGNVKHECGGFLISDRWVMTAAHCLPSGPNGRRVVLGAHSLSTAEETKQTFDILQLQNHPNFTENYDNDIALIKLDRPVVASDAVAMVKYLRAGGANPGTGAAVETTGWGSVNNLEGRTDTLKEVFISVVNWNLCARYDYYGDKLTANMLCAYRLCRSSPCSGPQKTEDSCDGDSGGPLLYNGVVVGITSNGGKKCGQVKKPGVYTVISRYTQWIDDTMAGESEPVIDATTLEP